MKKMQMMGLAAVALAGSAGGVVALTSHAGAPQGDDAALLAQASVALPQAVSIAEARTNGRAVEVALEGTAAAPTWEVTTVGSSGEQKAVIDAKSGSIRAVAADTDDRGEGEDGEEDDD